MARRTDPLHVDQRKKETRKVKKRTESFGRIEVSERERMEGGNAGVEKPSAQQQKSKRQKKTGAKKSFSS